ncbi:phosphatidate cytidylyltransferase [Pararhodospirillum oryzae]|uniref:phosphatidate cytidylyltransferase n=1 Tax=Pararhodospirillum oryzae TaxID=478448 RepID=UPI0011BDBE47|nr:phosphatidate cytidylyltransferase [Pararhodospirillum oryzae]
MLKTRILSALALAPPFLLAVYFGSPWFDVVAMAGGAVMGWEWARICHGGRFGPSGRMMSVGLALVAALVGPAPGLALAVIGAAALAVAWLDRAEPEARAWSITGVLYLGVTLMALVWVRWAGDWTTFVWLLAVVWATDSGAYACGRLIGGPLLAPRISPRKTWAGLIGGAVAALVAGGLVSSLLGVPSVWVWLLAPALAVISQMGDLFESFVKRRFNVKDSSHIIPGHGGVLDRMDGLLAAAVPVAGIVALFGEGISQWP